MTTTVGNRGQLRTSTLSGKLSPHLDLVVQPLDPPYRATALTAHTPLIKGVEVHPPN